MDQVSVIIANYNNEQYLKECIESVLRQDYKNIELIVVDDASTDNSREIIKYFEDIDKRVKGVFLDKNNGVSNARNVGAEFSSGTYLSFLDSDDFYNNPEKLSNEIMLIKKYKKEKGKDIIAYSAVTRVNERGHFIEDQGKNKMKFPQGNISIGLMAFYKSARNPRDYCMNKKIFENAGRYNTNMNFYEDFDLLIRLSLLAEFYCTFKSGTSYRLKDTDYPKTSK